jgi:hypothetical protein
MGVLHEPHSLNLVSLRVVEQILHELPSNTLSMERGLNCDWADIAHLVGQREKNRTYDMPISQGND